MCAASSGQSRTFLVVGRRLRVNGRWMGALFSGRANMAKKNALLASTANMGAPNFEIMSVNSLQACVLSLGRAGASDALPSLCSPKPSRGPSRQGPCLRAGGFHPGIRALSAPTLPAACLGVLFMSFASAVLVCFAHLRQSARENRPSGLSQTHLNPPVDPSRSRFPKLGRNPIAWLISLAAGQPREPPNLTLLVWRTYT